MENMSDTLVVQSKSLPNDTLPQEYYIANYLPSLGTPDLLFAPQCRPDPMVLSLAQVSPTTPQHQLIDRDILDIQDVASLLRCSVDTVRRIPKNELPAIKVKGRKKIYLREDLMEYIRALRIKPSSADQDCFEDMLR